MNKTVKKLINKICAILIIFALTISDFVLIGQSAISYALENVQTNHNNVNFMAYFLDEEGNKIDKISKNIKEGNASLYVEISVKNEGYLNGYLYLKDNNFNIKQENESPDISEISGNKVVLNQINAGSTVVLKLDIEPILEDTINIRSLDTQTEVVLEGKYIDSKNVEKKKSIEINGTSKVQLRWKSSDEIKSQLSANVLTNSIYKVNNEEKRVVQILVNSNILNNEYPVKNTEILLSVPKKTSDVTVYARSTEATNSNIEFTEKEYKFDTETNTVTVKLSNEEEENISWKKNAQDIFVVTYFMDKDEDITNTYVQIDSKLLTYDGKELKATGNIHINEDIQEIISYSKESKEDYIYKGKIYTGEEKEYSTYSQINVNYASDINNISVKENDAKFLIGEEEIDANIVYKSTKINKKEFIQLFGEEGYITIKDSNQNIIANITKDTAVDEKGDIIINYQPDVKNIEFTMSKPIIVGTLNLINTKAILNTGLSREEVKSLTGIKETLIGRYNENEYNTEIQKIIELKNTTSKATLAINTDKLSSTEKNENVRITAVLENNDESKDLYKNPIIRIAMPEKVTGFSAKCKLLYGNGLTLNKAEIIPENGKNVLQIELVGEQTTYNTEAVEGTTIVIYADIEVNRLATNSEEEIQLNYTNEIATDFEDKGEQKQKINIISTEGVITANNIKELGVQTVGDQGIKQVNIPVSSEEKGATVEINVINNEGSDISDVKIMGKFPTKKGDNLGIKLTSGINLVSTMEEIEIYYSEKEDPTTDLSDVSNGWTKNGNAETTKSYMIFIPSMKVGEQIKAEYNINIPLDLNYNQYAQEGYIVEYKNETTGVKKSINATTLNITTGIGPNIETDIKAKVANDIVGEGKAEATEEGAVVTTGEIIKYEVTLKNTGSEIATDLQIEQIVPETAVILEYGKRQEVNDNGGMSSVNVNKYTEKAEKSQTITIEKLDIGETKVQNLYVKVENAEDITSKIDIKYKDKMKTQYVTNKIKNSNIRNIQLQAGDIESDGQSIEEGKQYKYSLDISGLSASDMGNIEIEFMNNELLEINKIEYYDIDEAEKNDEYTGQTVEKTNKITAKKPTSINIYVTAKKPTNSQNNAELYAIVKEGESVIRTNVINKEVKTIEKVNNTTIELTATNAGENVELGQEIDYTIKIENPEDGMDIRNLQITDYLSNELDIARIECNGNVIPESEYYVNKDKESNATIINYNTSLQKGENANLVVRAIVNKEIVSYQDIEIENIAKAKIEDRMEMDTDKIIHLLDATAEDAVENPQIDEEEIEEVDEQESDEEENETENKNIVESNIVEESEKQVEEETISEQPQTNTNTQQLSQEPKQEEIAKTYTISGTVWLDVNEDGKRESSEEKIKDIEVILIDTKTNKIAVNSNQEEIKTLTDEEGYYSFSKIPQGKYIVAFKYDTEKYVLTQYQVEGIATTQNSDAEISNITLNEENLNVGVTDNIELIDSSKLNIDVGLVEAKIFDLKLAKTVSKLTVSNKEESQTKEYDGKTLAKTEIAAKYLSETTVVIEYKISVTNEGEVAGYAKNIVDYKPKDLSFNSSLNPEWYQSGDYLYSSSLANTILQPGETKEIALVLTKNMTENNTGLVNNTAEIESDYNKLGIQDIDSVVANKKQQEDDMSAANVIISVKTGAAVNYIAITLLIIIIIASGIYVVSKKILKENIEI